jgi:hypothetical protein
MATPPKLPSLIVASLIAAAGIILVTVFLAHRPSAPTAPPPTLKPLIAEEPPRTMPARFPPDTAMPDIKESIASGPINTNAFNANEELVRMENDNVWWESDNDQNDHEDDHLMHRNMKAPLNRLIVAVGEAGGRLKVQEAYRPSRIHNNRSLHREGRAIDVTCDEMTLETLAKLCWVSGFSWVYYEASGKGGAHIHCSIRR